LVEKKTIETLKIKTVILILMAGILLTGLASLPLVSAQPTNTSLTITVPYNPPWKAFTIEATLKDENGNPLQNFDIDFLYGCNNHTHPDHWHLLGPEKTDSNGVASLTLPWTGTFNVTAKFNGTPNYASSSSDYVTITIIDYTPYKVGCGLITVAIIGIVGYIVFRRRKKAITVPITTIGEKKMRINPLQIGFSIIMGWVIVLVSYLLYPIIGGKAMFWIVPFLGEIFIVLGFIEKERMISPQRAKILFQIGVVVTLICARGDIFGAIMVQKDGIIIDGEGHTLRGQQVVDERGIYLVGPDRSRPSCKNVLVTNLRILNFLEGIFVIGSSNNTIIGNYFENAGIHLLGSANYVGDLIKHNTFNGSVIFVDYNTGGLDVITENNFFEGRIYVGLSDTPIVEKNYWNDYNGTDNNGDGIGDTSYISPYILDEIVQDDYPLMAPLDIEVAPEFLSWTILPLFLTATLVIVFLRKKLKKGVKEG
jgi:hypothetical protein